MSGLVLYGNKFSTCTRRVLLTLAEKEAEAEFRNVDFQKMEQRSPEYMEKHQPFGKVPVLYDGEWKLYESRAIVRYLGT
jgi:glutathione S-transferase